MHSEETVQSAVDVEKTISCNGDWIDLRSVRWWKLEGKPIQNVGSSGNCMDKPQFI